MTTTCQRVRELAPGYVLGALEPAEMLAVREHLDTCKNPHPEMRELGGVVAYLGLALDPVEPSASVKDAVMTSAKADLSARRRNDEAAERLVATLGSRARTREAAAPAGTAVASGAKPVDSAHVETEPVTTEASEHTAGEPGKVLVFNRFRPRQVAQWIVSLAAAIVLLVGTGIVIGQNNAAKPAATADPLASVYNAIRQGRWTVSLRSDGGDIPSGVAVRMSTGDLLVFLNGLPPTSGSQVYEVWLVPQGGAAVPVAGNPTEGGSATFTITSSLTDTAATILVTREKSPDAKAPTLPAVLTGTLPNGAPTPSQ